MNPIVTIRAFHDNFIYLYRYDQYKAIAIDPSDSSSVLKALEKHSLHLTTILATHHHWDHIVGISELKKKTGCKIIGGDKQRINGIDNVVEDGQILTFEDLTINVIATPGHTRTGICYYIPHDQEDGILFTGDTLFIGGCGRLFECNAQTMWDSLQKLATLPDNTNVYCGHDYTLENYEFALENEPHNASIQQRLSEIRQAVQQGKLTIPSTIAQEKTTNVFMSAKTPEIFAELRRRKDIFG
jgi:hydroxyacylglutathione hydrolase